jgi:putative ABC transport system substrate-binding protein
MRRRDFITLIGGAAAWPLAARAQLPGVPVIGYLSSGSPTEFAALAAAFRQGLSATGFVDGRNVAIEYRWAEGHYERLPGLAAELVRRQVALIAATGGIPSVGAAKAATTTIPIVFNAGVDPVDAGLVASLNRPGGNLTGVVTLSVEVGPKRLQLLHEALPTTAVIAVLVNPTNPNVDAVSRDIQAAGRAVGVEVHVLQASTGKDLEAVFTTVIRLGASALVIGADAYFLSQAQQLAALTLRYAVPTIFNYREFAAAGGLMSYGPSNTDVYRQVGVYAARILKGERPAELPVQQVTKLDLVINLKTAKALGLEISPTFLLRADELIE